VAKDGPAKAKGKRLHGQGKSERDIAGLCKVTRATAKRWIDEWETHDFPKGFLQPKLDQAQTDAAIAAAHAAGLTEAKVAEKVAALMEAQKTVFWQGEEVTNVEDNGTQLGAASLGADILRMKGSRLDITTGGRSLLDEVLDEA
jgi:transposase